MLRSYQQNAVTGLKRSISAGNKRPVLVCPTGGGKTHIACAVVQGAVEKGNEVLFLAPRRELIYQAHERLQEFGVDAGIIMAGEMRSPYSRVQVASFDTLHARGMRTERMLMPDADVVIVDEAHLSIAQTRKDIIGHYHDKAIVIGLTATPARGDGRGLGEIYDDLVETVTMRQLVDEGFLVPTRYFAPSKPDLEGVKIRMGDYTVKGLNEKMDQPKLVGDIVENWCRIAGDKRTVVFCVTRAHSRHVCEEFNRIRVKAEHLDGETPLDERKEILDRVRSGETQVLSNVYVATFGLDIPELECCVLARPTKNITLYLQTAGRVLRPAPGKEHAILIDHAGAVDEHGFLDDPIPWSLDGESKVKDRKKEAQLEHAEPKEITCKQCQTVFKGSRICPGCGHQMIPPGKPVPVYEANLKEVGRDVAKINRQATPEQKAEFFGGLKGYALKHKYNSGWCAHKYREMYGVWPNAYKSAKAIEPNREVLNFIRYTQIKYAKRRTA